MNLLANLKVALVALRTNLMRSVLTMLGIIIGVGAVIGAVSVGKGAQRMVENQINALGANLLVVFPGGGHRGPVRGTSSGVPLTLADAQVLATRIAQARAVAAMVRGGAQAVLGNANWGTQLVGVTPAYREARDLELAEGRFITNAEVRAAAKVAVLGARVVEELFGESLAVGATIRVNRTPLKIVGVLKKKGQSGFGSDQDDVVIVPITTATKRLLGQRRGRADAVNTIFVEAQSRADIPLVERRIREILRERKHVRAGADDPFRIVNTAQMQEFGDQATTIFSMLLGSIASISLVVGGIGIMNIMLVSVTERTREIGLRMALGARRRDILSQFLVEAVVLSAIGGMIGVLLGITLARAIARFAGWPAQVDLPIIFIAVGFSAIFGIFFGFYPARKAARQNPIDALRYE
ncbi:MAG: FtsX-like permease family protein [Alphaproteobacteria bacterium]|nr:MAG: FtsX-like permease family protein [Alphaproteobacteria bacterium]